VGDEESFRRFVAERRAVLLATALLLTGDRGPAEDLVQRTLARGRRRWRRLAGSGDPTAGVEQLLVRGASDRAARRRAAQVVEDLPDPSAPPSSPVAGVLRGLDPATRAATVLRWYRQRPAAEAAPLLGVPEEDARAAAERGRAALLAVLDARDALFRRHGAPAPDPADDDRRLHRALAAVAEPPGRWRLDAAEAADDARSRVRRDTRHLAGALAAAAAVVAIAVPLTRALPDAPPADPAAAAATTTATQTATQTAPEAAPLPRAAVLAGPTRGSLAGDAAFLDAVRAVDWGAQEAPPPGDREVVLATDTPDGRVALVVGRVDDDFRGVWLTGPVGAAAADLQVRLPRGLGRDRPLSLVLGGPGPATLVVVAAPGDRVEASPRLLVGPRGTVGRTYEEAATVDGVAEVAVRTTLDGTGVSVRVVREGRTVHRSGAAWPGAGRGGTPDVPVTDLLRPVPAPPDEGLVQIALRSVAVPLGVEPAALEPDLLWASPLPAGGRPGAVAVAVARSPGGGLVLTTWVAGVAGVAACGTQTPPGSVDPTLLTVVRECVLPLPGGGSGEDRWLVVTAPGQATTAEVVDGSGGQLATLSLTDGSAVVPLPDGAATVLTRRSDGALLAETAVAPAAAEPFGDYGQGPAG
jgi:DNA-directed RNA polymerase specialized sigma24 family protein